jgi:biotin operon repressor
MTQDLKEKIRAAAPEGKLPCAAAFKLAEQLGISRKEMGELLNELKIKVTQCQLGCF